MSNAEGHRRIVETVQRSADDHCGFPGRFEVRGAIGRPLSWRAKTRSSSTTELPASASAPGSARARVSTMPAMSSSVWCVVRVTRTPHRLATASNESLSGRTLDP